MNNANTFFCFWFYSRLKNEIHNFNTQLTITIKNNEKLYNIIQLSDSLFKAYYEKNMNALKNRYQILSGEDQKSNKVKYTISNYIQIKQYIFF